MFIAMNRFRVLRGQEQAFEAVWLERDTQLAGVPGFVAFHLLRGPEAEDHTLFSSHTVWRSREAFEAWTRSEAFRAAHKGAGGNAPLYLGHPQFEGFEVIQEVLPASEPAFARLTPAAPGRSSDRAAARGHPGRDGGLPGRCVAGQGTFPAIGPEGAATLRLAAWAR